MVIAFLAFFGMMPARGRERPIPSPERRRTRQRQIDTTQDFGKSSFFKAAAPTASRPDAVIALDIALTFRYVTPVFAAGYGVSGVRRSEQAAERRIARQRRHRMLRGDGLLRFIFPAAHCLR